MTDEILKEKIDRINELQTFMDSFSKEIEMLSKQVFEELENRSEKEVITPNSHAIIKQGSVRYKYSEKVAEIEEKILKATEELKEERATLMDYEKKSGIAKKEVGESKLVIKAIKND